MERVSVGGRTYSDPDVLSLIGSAAKRVDPRHEVVRLARALNQRLRTFGDPPTSPRQRMELLASLKGIKVGEMTGTGLGQSAREALIYRDKDGSRRAYFDPTYSEARVNFSIAHEIVHSFFRNSTNGARFRSICAEDSREANELERLCDLGASELLLPQDEFLTELGDDFGIAAIPRLCKRFGSSFEATLYRLATAYEGIAVAGRLRHRHRKDELRRSSAQRWLFQPDREDEVPPPKYRRQSLHLSMKCGPDHIVQWNKSFDEDSAVYRIVDSAEVQRGYESLPNTSSAYGHIEAAWAPYQRPNDESDLPDVLFLWWID